MRRAILPAVLGGLILLSSPSFGAETHYVSWQGRWVLNEAESHYPPGFPVIHDHVMVVAKDDGKVLQFTDSMTIDGKKNSMSYDGAYDGRPYRMSNGQMMAFQHVSADTYGDNWISDQGTVGEDRCVFSNKGVRMTCQGSFTPAKGQKISFVEVWDKAP